jgi:hypothetical protein
MTISKFETARFLSHIQWLKAIAVAISCVTTPAIAASSNTSAELAGARAMTAFEIYELYKDKSWQWDNGAGHMTSAGRQFSAWVDDEKGKSWAEGRWVITETGWLCLNATWYSERGAFPAKTCFSHRIDNGVIYQKREPTGEWFVFRHSRPKDSDEAHKLVATDLVSQQRDNIKTTLRTAQLSAQ